MPTEALYRGDLKPGLDLIWDRPEAMESLPHNGDVRAAQKIARLAGIID